MSAIEGRKPASGKNGDAFSAASEGLNKAIEAKKDYTEVLRQLEENYANFVKSQIAYHEFLTNAAEHKGDLQLYMHHKVMLVPDDPCQPQAFKQIRDGLMFFRHAS